MTGVVGGIEERTSARPSAGMTRVVRLAGFGDVGAEEFLGAGGGFVGDAGAVPLLVAFVGGLLGVFFEAGFEEGEGFLGGVGELEEVACP